METKIKEIMVRLPAAELEAYIEETGISASQANFAQKIQRLNIDIEEEECINIRYHQ